MALAKQVNCRESTPQAFMVELIPKKRETQVVVTDVEPKKLSGFRAPLCEVRGGHRTFIIAQSSFDLNHP